MVYIVSNGGPSTHTDAFMKEYNADYRNCLTSLSHVAPNVGDNKTLPNKDQLTSSSNITSGHTLNYSLGSNEPVSDYDKGCSDVKHGDNQYLLQLGAKRLTNNSTGGYNDGFHSCFYSEHIVICPSISYDGSIVAYIDTKNNDTVISSANAKGTLSKVTTINSDTCPTLSGNGREVSYEKPDSDPGLYQTDFYVTDLSNVLFPSSTSNINTLKNTTTLIDNDNEGGDSLDSHTLSFSGKTLVYSYDNIDSDDGPTTYTSISTKNNHGDFKKPNILYTYLLTDNVSDHSPPSASLSGDGKNIVFNNQTGKDRLEIFITKVVNLNKTDQVTIKGINSDNSYNYFPAVSYDGKTIAYVSNNGIYVAKLNERGEWITSNVVSNSTFNNIIDANNTRFSLSPDGNKIAYAAFDSAFKQIFVKDISNMPLDNNDIKGQSNDRSTVGKTIQVTHDNFNNFEPVLSLMEARSHFKVEIRWL